MAEEKATPKARPSRAPKPKVVAVDHRVSVSGAGDYRVGNKTLKHGMHYKLKDLGLNEKATMDLKTDPHVAVEPVDKDGKVIEPDEE